MVPVWMDGALRRALHVDAARRYGELTELVYDLRHPNLIFSRQAPLPLVARDPIRLWKCIAGLLAVSNALMLWWLFR